jgi:protein SCO1/2
MERMKVSVSKIFVAALGVSVLLAGGCHRAANAGTGAAGDQYNVRGTIVSADEATGTVVLDEEAVPGYMDAMTMTYRLKDANAATELHKGDRIVARLTVNDVAGADTSTLDQINVIAQANPNVLPKVQYHVPAVGDSVPDFTLINENAQKISLAQYRGKVLAITFIYTRCQLANFCPQMSHNFAQVNSDLEKNPSLAPLTHLISISFDPAYDTPKVLKSYGGAYTGNYTREKFQHWNFAAPPLAELPRMEQWFDLGVTPGEGKTLSHSLSTMIIGKDGKVVAFYPTNGWTVADLEANIMAAAKA